MKKILVAAGGTGGHLFPALAVVEKIKNLLGDEIDFEFFGSKDKIEGRVVPQLNYKLYDTDLYKYMNKKIFNIARLPFKILSEALRMRNILSRNNIDAVICAGAYLSLPPGIAAGFTKSKLILLESNVNPGKAINFLASRADLIYTSFEETEKYFKPEYATKIKYLGNPIRSEILKNESQKAAKHTLNLHPDKSVVLIFGGSLGAKSINDAVIAHFEKFIASNYQLIWQTGNSYQMGNEINKNSLPENIKIVNFIDDMATAYAAADIVISRSGATTVAELCVIGKPAVLVPLPSASNNEQYYNAKVLEKHEAAILVKDSDIGAQLYLLIDELLANQDKLCQMGKNALKLGKPNATSSIADEIINFI